MGTLATAEIVKASKRKCWGKSGKLIIRMRELKFSNGTTIALTAPDIEKNGVSKKEMLGLGFGVPYFLFL